MTAYEAPNDMQIALYKGAYKQSEIDTLNIQKVLRLPVAAICSTPPKAIKRGWWGFVGNYDVPYDMPYQAYMRIDGVLIDRQESCLKPAVGYENINFLPARVYVTSGVLVGIAQIVEGLIPTDGRYVKRFLPNPEAVVWKIFPEYYPEPVKPV